MDGIINIYKEAGYTSFDVVAKLRGILKERKIGHTGTLDPEATGVLPVCIGKATKLCELMLDKEKTYEAVMLLGVTTDTEDLTGKVLQTQNVQVTEEEVIRATEKFTGVYEQVPPMYSALKVDGKRLYELAREGKEVERKPRTVEIYENKPLCMVRNAVGSIDQVILNVRCSKGTYIRSLIRDMGEYLGCGACMKSLMRTQAGAFSIGDALTLAEVEEARDEGRLSEIILPIDSFLMKYPEVSVVPEFEKYLYNGNQLSLNMLSGKINPSEGDGFRVYDTNGKLIGLYLYRANRRQLQPEKMFLP